MSVNKTKWNGKLKSGKVRKWSFKDIDKDKIVGDTGSNTVIQKAKADEIIRSFKKACKDAGLPVPEHEYIYRNFHPTFPRGYKGDFVWPDLGLSLEVDGGLRMQAGGHNTAAGISRDMHKGNMVQMILKWKFIRVVPERLHDHGILILRSVVEDDISILEDYFKLKTVFDL